MPPKKRSNVWPWRINTRPVPGIWWRKTSDSIYAPSRWTISDVCTKRKIYICSTVSSFSDESKRRLGKLHTAIQYMEKALKIESNTPTCDNPAGTHLNICAILSELGRYVFIMFCSARRWLTINHLAIARLRIMPNVRFNWSNINVFWKWKKWEIKINKRKKTKKNRWINRWKRPRRVYWQWHISITVLNWNICDALIKLYLRISKLDTSGLKNWWKQVHSWRKLRLPSCKLEGSPKLIQRLRLPWRVLAMWKKLQIHLRQPWVHVRNPHVHFVCRVNNHPKSKRHFWRQK